MVMIMTYPEVIASIHFPLAREDPVSHPLLFCTLCFNPLPSCEGRRHLRALLSTLSVLQSTSLLRGKTYGADSPVEEEPCFNPLPSCEGRRDGTIHERFQKVLQSTSLLRGKTHFAKPSPQTTELQSTSLLRGKTSKSNAKGAIFACASIHFPLAREDIQTERREQAKEGFNPLPSCEGRPQGNDIIIDDGVLQSTSLLRGKTLCAAGL